MSDSHHNAFFHAAEKVDAPVLHRRPTLGEEVYETLLAQLIALKIAPGSKIAVDALVREMGVSQTPIRAALIRLENEGLVIKTHNVGYSAAPMPSRERFEQMYELRLLLEPAAAKRTAEKLSAEVRAELIMLDEAMAAPGSADEKRAYSQFALADAKFHNLIASSNPLVAEALARSYAHMHLFRLHYHAVVTDGAVQEHAVILKEIIVGNGRAAKKAMEHHLVRSLERWRPFFEATG